MSKPLLVGEANPYGGDPDFALYPSPPGCAGARLCRKVMGLDEDAYLEKFDRTNLCPRKWSTRLARETAIRIELERVGSVVVLLGSRVARAFGFPYVPFAPPFVDLMTVVVLPHPSGRCRAWCEPGAFDRARAVLKQAWAL